MITDVMNSNGDNWDNVVGVAGEDGLDRPFDTGYGGENGDPFTLWTHEWVYFPACYDGAEWVASVPRNPCDKQTMHVGGG